MRLFNISLIALSLCFFSCNNAPEEKNSDKDSIVSSEIEMLVENNEINEAEPEITAESEEEINSLPFMLEYTKEGEEPYPITKISVKINEVVTEIENLPGEASILKQEDYSTWNIPENSIKALVCGYAGLQVTLCIVETSEKYTVLKYSNDEGHITEWAEIKTISK